MDSLVLLLCYSCATLVLCSWWVSIAEFGTSKLLVLTADCWLLPAGCCLLTESRWGSVLFSFSLSLSLPSASVFSCPYSLNVRTPMLFSSMTSHLLRVQPSKPPYLPYIPYIPYISYISFIHQPHLVVYLGLLYYSCCNLPIYHPPSAIYHSPFTIYPALQQACGVLHGILVTRIKKRDLTVARMDRQWQWPWQWQWQLHRQWHYQRRAKRKERREKRNCNCNCNWRCRYGQRQY